MAGQLGIAVLGCGYWGMNYVRIFHELPEVRVTAVCDQRSERLQEVGRRFPGVVLTNDIDDMLQLDAVDAVIICTQATAHYDAIRRCVNAGKHILVEKPITTNSAEAEDVINLAESKGVTLMVGHTFLYNAGIRKVKACIEDDEAGRIYYLYSRRTNLGPIRQDVNALWDLAPHDVSIFNYLVNSRPEWVSAVGAKVLHNCREDVGFVSLGYPDGIIGHIHVSWADPNKVREVVVVSSNRRIVFDDLNALEQVRVFEKGVMPTSDEASNYGENRFSIRDGDIISPKFEIAEPLKDQCFHFLTCVAQGQRPLTCGQAGLDVVRVMEAIDRSIAHQGKPVEV